MVRESREIFPHRLEKPTPHQRDRVPWRQRRRRRWRRRGRDARRAAGATKRGGEERVTQGGLGGGWGRQPQKYTATTPRGSTAEAAIFHRRTETRPRELNTLSYFLRVEATLPPAEATAR